VIKRPR